jgi:hypothetical protein
MSWLDFHAGSEKLAIEALASSRHGESDRALDLYKQAAELEQKALEQLDETKERTRGITAVSAVALWLKAAEYSLAEKLAYAMLSDTKIPDFAREQLRDLVQAIWTETAKAKAGVAFIPGQVMVSVKGGEVVTGGAPLDLIVEKVQTIQSIFYRTVEFLKGLDHRKAGPPPKHLQDSCRPWLFQLAPGSYQFSVAIQKPAQPDFFEQNLEPEQIARRFLEIIRLSSTGDKIGLERLVPNETYRATFLKLTRNLAPTGKTFDQIELRVPMEGQAVGLNVESRNSINQQLREKLSGAAVESNPPVELRGTLRAVHLDQDWLDVSVDGRPVHIRELGDTVDDVIGPMVNRAVIVRVVRLPLGKLKFVDIELAD